MKLLISYRAITAIEKFYHNVAKKYKHTYSARLMHANIDDAIDGMYLIEAGLLRKIPNTPKWKGYYMANFQTWYYAYTFDGETIRVVDACHVQNMKEEFK